MLYLRLGAVTVTQYVCCADIAAGRVDFDVTNTCLAANRDSGTASPAGHSPAEQTKADAASGMGSALVVALVRLWPEWRKALILVKPETVIGWHRKGLRFYWNWKSRRGRIGRPGLSKEIRDLIRDMSSANVLWGAPRLHGELLKLGIEVSQATVAKYMVKQRKPPSQTWRTFLENHVKQLVSVDFFVVPTVSFRILYVFLVLSHERRRVVHFNVTEHPTAEWTAAQLMRHALRGRAHMSNG